METKRCTKCGDTKPLTDFYKCKGGVGGVRGDCKSCFAVRAHAWYEQNREHVIERVKQWRKDNRERALETERKVRARRKPAAREDHLKRTFGISQSDYERMLHEQGGGCGICGRPPRERSSLHVDHDHRTGTVRGLLASGATADSVSSPRTTNDSQWRWRTWRGTTSCTHRQSHAPLPYGGLEGTRIGFVHS